MGIARAGDYVIRFVPDLLEKVPSVRIYRRTLLRRTRSFPRRRTKLIGFD